MSEHESNNNNQGGNNHYVPGSYSSNPANSTGQGPEPAAGAANNSYSYPQQPVYSASTYNDQYSPAGKPAGHGLGIAALVLGILAILTCWFGLGLILGIVGLILGIIALVKMKKVPGAKRGLAIAGTVLSGIGIVLGAIVSILFFLLGGIALDAHNACSQHEPGSVAYEQCVTDWTENHLPNQ